MGIKEAPIGIKTYYKCIKRDYANIKEDTLQVIDKLKTEINVDTEDIKNNLDVYKNKFNINLMDYDEFVNKRYTTGKFNKMAKGLYLNRNNNYELTGELYNLVKLSTKQKELKEYEEGLDVCNKIEGLNLKDFTNILKVFYTKVHEKMIKEGAGYVLEGNLGWLCINRCVIDKQRPMLDFNATKKREQELKAAGKKIWNKEEADWCAAKGIEYKAEDKRVFRNDACCYEIPIIGSTIKGRSSLRFTSAVYVGSSIKHQGYDDWLKLVNNVDDALKLPLDIRKKLYMCLKLDKDLYIKFIRNEHQKPIISPKINRKD